MHAPPSIPARPADAAPVGHSSDWPAPKWATDLFAAADRRPVADHGPLTVSVSATDRASLVSVRICGADAMSPAEVERATSDAYTAIAGELSALPASHPVRFWNYLPDIHRRSGAAADGRPLDRYMVFNAGRHAACSRWFGGEDAFPRSLATASGVGHADADLVVHALAGREPGVAVENPRQVPAYRYSQRYGPKPPCFARATVVRRPTDGRPFVLVGGTASVRGEASVHVGDLPGQMAETAENLAALLRAARAAVGGDGQPADGEPTAESAVGVADTETFGSVDVPSPDPLPAFAEVRVYYVRPTDLEALRAMSRAAFPAATLEFVRADLCRQDLLVEIEGVAALR